MEQNDIYCTSVEIIGDDIKELDEDFFISFNAGPDQFMQNSVVSYVITDDGDSKLCN